jgi:hypothetical protein
MNRYVLTSMLSRSSALLLIVLTSFTVVPRCLAAQMPQATVPPPGSAQRQRPDDAMQEKIEHDAAQARNVQRQQEIRRDSEKLLELATELKQYVDKTNENIISLDVIRKADQIEKLAKSVKEKMKAQ